MMPPESVMIHFWKRVDKSGDCWVWNGLKQTRNGRAAARFHWRGGNIGAQILSYRLAVGDVPFGHVIRPACGEPMCVKPDHLQTESRILKAHAGRKGWTGRRFNESDVDAILDRLEQGEPTYSVAKSYDVRGTLIQRIKNFTGWAHVGDPDRRRRIADLPDNRVVSDLTFWRNVDKTGDCWVWTSKISNTGYGMFGKHLAHRYSMRFKIGQIPEPSTLVRHLCHNRKCVRPDHLELGDHYDNFQDNVRDNRSVIAKLDERQAAEIRELFASGEKIKNIAAAYRVSVGCVSDIVWGRRWRPRRFKSAPMPTKWFLIQAGERKCSMWT